MSIVSTLALMATALVARIKNPDVEITRLKAQIDDLTRERDGWRDLWLALIRERDQWQRPTRESIQQAQQAQQQANLANQWLSQAAQMQSVQAQINAFADGSFCNCVPARHDLLMLRPRS